MTPTQVSRDLEDLIEEGLVIRLDNGNFSYAMLTLQIAERFRKQHEQLQERLKEISYRMEVGSQF